MPTIAEWEERYEVGFKPWDTGRPDEYLVRAVREQPIPACRALEIGCGTGTNAIWLAEQGFEVLATDVAANALQMARPKIDEAGVKVTLLHGSFPTDVAPFGFAFDRGCLHTLDEAEERAAFAEQVASHLDADGLWLSIIGSTDGPPRDHGPPRRSAHEVMEAVESHFEILSLHVGTLEAETPTPPRVWICLMKKRTVYS